MLKITISGGPGEGKTTLAIWLSAIMRAAGFDVHVEDSDIESGTSYPDLQERRLDALVRRRQTVDIVTVQTQKGR